MFSNDTLGRKSAPHWLLVWTRTLNSFTLSWKYFGSVQFHVKLTLGKIVRLSFLILRLVYAVWFLPRCTTSFRSPPLLIKITSNTHYFLMSSLIISSIKLYFGIIFQIFLSTEYWTSTQGMYQSHFIFFHKII